MKKQIESLNESQLEAIAAGDTSLSKEVEAAIGAVQANEDRQHAWARYAALQRIRSNPERAEGLLAGLGGD